MESLKAAATIYFGERTENGTKVYTEVSKGTFTYSKYHVYSIFITWPLLMLG
jgi:hypothetical protein